MVALGCIVIWLLAACPDLLAPVCPFFMAFLMSTQCYGQLSDFLPCAALVPPLVLALLWHFAVWPVTLRLGRSGMGLALVSIATLLGGCDVITRKQAVEPLSLYYTLGLGVGMLVLYVLFRSHLTEKRTYDLHRRFAGIFCALGMCMALAVLLAYLKAVDVRRPPEKEISPPPKSEKTPERQEGFFDGIPGVPVDEIFGKEERS